MHPASLASPSAHARSSSLRRPWRIELEAFATAAHSAGHIPGCPKGSRPLTSSASTHTHTHSSLLSSRGSGNCAARQEQTGNMYKTELCDFLSRAKAFRHFSASGPSGGTGGSEPHAGTVNLDRASGVPEYEVAIYQVIESRVVC